MGVVKQTIQDGVRVGRVGDDVVPSGDGKLARDDGGTTPIPLLQDFQQVVPGFGVVSDDDYVGRLTTTEMAGT